MLDTITIILTFLIVPLQLLILYQQRQSLMLRRAQAKVDQEHREAMSEEIGTLATTIETIVHQNSSLVGMQRRPPGSSTLPPHPDERDRL